MKFQRPASGNMAAMMAQHAVDYPDKLALLVPRAWDDTGTTESAQFTFGQMWHRVQQFMTGLEANGIGPGDRVLLAFPLSADLYALALALFARGATAILVDASMGRKKVKRAVAASGARAIVSVNALLKYRWFIGAIRRIPLKFSFDKAGWGVHAIDKLAITEPDPALAPIERTADDEALITYTSGSTGDPKGSDRTHGLLIEQVLTYPQLTAVDDDHTMFPAFPVVALGGLCLGVTTVLPPVDFARPDSVNPAALVGELAKWSIANLAGPPIYVQRLAEYVIEHGLDVRPKQLWVGGAPVSRRLCELMAKAFPHTECFVIYGSTEAEPMAHIEIRELAACEHHAAYPAGRIVDVATIALIDLGDAPPELGDTGVEPFRVGHGQIGEVVVSGAHVNRRYVDNDAATRENKLFEVDGTVWHRTGDLAYQDDDGLLWLVGRRNYAVERNGCVVQAFPVEIALEQVPQIARAALVATTKRPTGVVAVVAARDVEAADVLIGAAAALAELNLGDIEVCIIDEMPVDNRHNSKVDRVALRALLG